MQQEILPRHTLLHSLPMQGTEGLGGTSDLEDSKDRHTTILRRPKTIVSKILHNMKIRKDGRCQARVSFKISVSTTVPPGQALESALLFLRALPILV